MASAFQTTFDAMSADDRTALMRYRTTEGRTWKAKLRTLWMLSALDRHPDGSALRRVRNLIGPSGLDRIRF